MKDLNPPILTHILNVNVMMVATITKDLLCARFHLILITALEDKYSFSL